MESNMNKDCNIVNDLLPLYVDDVLSADSKQFVEEHLSSCDNCKDQLDKMKADITTLPKDNDTKPFKKIKRKLITRLILIVVLAAALLVGWVFVWTTYIPVKYIGEQFYADMDVVFMDDGAYLRRDNLCSRGDVIISYIDNDKENGVIGLYIAESVPDHFRLGWYESTCYTKISNDLIVPENIKQVVYTDKNGNPLQTLWEKE